MPWNFSGTPMTVSYSGATSATGGEWILVPANYTATSSTTPEVLTSALHDMFTDPYRNYTVQQWYTDAEITVYDVETEIIHGRVESPEEAAARAEIMARHREARAERAQAREREAEEHRLIRESAQQQAHELLKSVLTPEQWQSYRDSQGFLVVGSDGYTYRIESYTSGNIIKLDSDGTDRIRYCAHPHLYEYEYDYRRELPVEDVLVGQVLALRTDAPALLAVANIHEQWDAAGNWLRDAEDLVQEFDP